MTEQNRQLSRQDILNMLPQGDRFMFLESAEIIEPGRTARGKLIPFSQPGFEYLDDHIPGAPIFPGTLLLEASADLLAVAARSGENMGDKIGILRDGRVQRITRFVKPGEEITLEVEVQRIVRGMGGRGVGRVTDENGNRICDTSIVFGLVDLQTLK